MGHTSEAQPIGSRCATHDAVSVHRKARCDLLDIVPNRILSLQPYPSRVYKEGQGSPSGQEHTDPKRSDHKQYNPIETQDVGYYVMLIAQTCLHRVLCHI
jgi:hypothetical protein